MSFQNYPKFGLWIIINCNCRLPPLQPDPQGTGQDNINNNVDAEKQESDDSVNLSPIISQCPKSKKRIGIRDFYERKNWEPEPASNSVDKLTNESIGQDYDADMARLKVFCNSLPESMDIDDSTSEELESEVMSQDADASKAKETVIDKSSDEYNLRLEPSQSSTDLKRSPEEEEEKAAGSIIPSNTVPQENPRVSVSSIGDEPGIRIHVEKDASCLSSLQTIDGSGVIPSSESSTNPFNTWQYWRIPCPEIEVDIDMAESGKTNVHVRAKVVDTTNQTTYASDLNVNIVRKDPMSLNEKSDNDESEESKYVNKIEAGVSPGEFLDSLVILVN
jgi:hypothetical protein